MKTTLVLIIAAFLAALIIYPFVSFITPPVRVSPSLAGELYQQPLPSQAEIQQHINAILSVHGMKTITEDGVCGPETIQAWDKAEALQDGYLLTKQAILEKERK